MGEEKTAKEKRMEVMKAKFPSPSQWDPKPPPSLTNTLQTMQT